MQFSKEQLNRLYYLAAVGAVVELAQREREDNGDEDVCNQCAEEFYFMARRSVMRQITELAFKMDEESGDLEDACIVLEAARSGAFTYDDLETANGAAIAALTAYANEYLRWARTEEDNDHDEDLEALVKIRAERAVKAAARADAISAGLWKHAEEAKAKDAQEQQQSQMAEPTAEPAVEQ